MDDTGLVERYLEHVRVEKRLAQRTVELYALDLQKLQENYVAMANHIADATTGSIRRELVELALHAQRVGTDASVRMAQLMNEFASRMGGAYRGRASSGLDAAREYGVNMTMLTSGLLAGFADALRQQSESRKSR